MNKRVISALVGILILMGVLFTNNMLIIRAAAAVCSLMALYELYHAFGYLREKLLVALGAAAALCITFGQLFDIKFIIPLIFLYIIL